MSIALSAYSLYQIIFGVLFFWFGIYLVSRNPYSKISWITFGILAGFGNMLSFDPVLRITRTMSEYILYQKITDWTLFLVPVMYLHASILIKDKRSRIWSLFVIFAYLVGITFYLSDIHGGLVLKETIVRYQDYKRFDGFAPGVLLAPSVIFVIICMAIGAINFLTQIKKHFFKYFLPSLGGFLYMVTGIIVLLSYYNLWPWAVYIFDIGCGFGTMLIIYSMVRYHIFAPTENIFNKMFYLKTISILIILMVYIGAFLISGVQMTFPTFVLMELIVYLVLLTHAFYDWFNTFLNDIQFNALSGLSIVNDKEIYEALKNYNHPVALESSTLLRLSLINKITKSVKQTPVDSLREILSQAIEYFKPKDASKRTKQNIKYHLLKMMVLDEAEEGQILWELGFEDYPVRIMAQEAKYRKPLLEIKSPSDYTYTSRNAFIALKKEAIHDVTWRISYLEKLSKRKLVE